MIKKTTPITITIILLSFLISSCNSDDTEVVEDNSNEILFEITDFAPNQGIEGTEITINGSNFGDSAENVEITLNNIPAKITEFSDTTIKIIAPQNNRGTAAIVRLLINSKVQSFDQTFLYPVPSIEDFMPKTNVQFKDITITGNNFSNDPSRIKVIINNQEQPIISSNLTSIVFQTNNFNFFLQEFPISVEIDGARVTSKDNYTYGAQFQVTGALVNNNFKNNVPLCPGSAINLNINDNRGANANISIGFGVRPIFLFNDIEATILSTFPAGNRGRDILINIPTSTPIGTAKLSATVESTPLIPNQIDQIEIGEGTFKLESNTIEPVLAFTIELSHIFREPRKMIVRLKNIADDSVIMGRIVNDSFSEDLTKTNLLVNGLNETGIYEVSVFTADDVYELKPFDNNLLTVTR